jgi:hypothetical protein
MNFKLIFFFIFTYVNIYANSVYDLNLLILQSKVFPKVILADYNINEKVIDNKIVFTILYEEIDTNIANKFKKMIEQNYPKLKEYEVELRLLQYKDFSRKTQLDTAYIFLLGKEKEITEISKFITNNKRLSFSYDKNYVDYGVIFGLEISSTVSLLLNLNSLKQSQINLENSIFKVTKIK